MRTMSTVGSGPDGGRKKRRVTNLLLNRSFQLKYTALIVGMSASLSTGLGFFLVRQMRENSRMLQLDAELDAVFQEQLARADAENALVLIGALVLFNVLLALGAIYVTHRMAGPMFVFRRYLRLLGEGKIPRVRRLRRGDEFGDVIEQLRETVSAIEMRALSETSSLERALGALDREDAAVARREISDLLTQKRGG